ncbi:TlpA disulfide reductase family protein [Bacteroidales bacterium]
MKKIIFFAALVGLFACQPKHDGYIIEGTITGENLPEGKAILSNFARAEQISDTVDFIGGKFRFEGKVVTPENYAITIEGINGRIQFFLDNSEIIIEGAAEDFPNAKVTGGVTNDLVMGLRKQQEEIGAKYGLDSLMREYGKKETTPERKAEIIAVYNQSQKEANAVDSAFQAANPNSFYTLIQLTQKVEDYPMAEMEAKVAAFKALPEFEGNRYIAQIEESLATLKTLEVGMVAPDFTMNDPQGNPIALSSVYPNNKITMIDFWAGWCGPCRRFNPTLVEIYKKYNKLGFGVFGVSFDKDAELWNSAIKDDKLTWPQVSDLQYWNSAAAKLYHVKYIPQNIFVDSEGKIIKRKVTEEELVSFIEEQLGITAK